MSTMTPLPENDPMMLAWKDHKATEDYENSVRWAQNLGAVTITPGPHGTVLTADHPHLEGSLWGLFIAGYEKGRTTRGKEISQVVDAFDVVKKAMKDDPDLAWSWHCNIAMSFYDELGPMVEPSAVRHEVCNRAAARFMKLCFDVDTSEHPQFTPEQPISAMPDAPESYQGTD